MRRGKPIALAIIGGGAGSVLKEEETERRGGGGRRSRRERVEGRGRMDALVTTWRSGSSLAQGTEAIECLAE